MIIMIRLYLRSNLQIYYLTEPGMAEYDCLLGSVCKNRGEDFLSSQLWISPDREIYSGEPRVMKVALFEQSLTAAVEESETGEIMTVHLGNDLGESQS